MVYLTTNLQSGPFVVVQGHCNQLPRAFLMRKQFILIVVILTLVYSSKATKNPALGGIIVYNDLDGNVQALVMYENIRGNAPIDLDVHEVSSCKLMVSIFTKN